MGSGCMHSRLMKVLLVSAASAGGPVCVCLGLQSRKSGPQAPRVWVVFLAGAQGPGQGACVQAHAATSLGGGETEHLATADSHSLLPRRTL